jgi:GT2 family glycosyltransferase
MTARHIAGAAGPPPGAYDADVVILSLDRTEETTAAIRSALVQRGVSRHVFIVDQGSRPDALARLVAEVTGRRDATLMALDRNRGVAGGRNVGSSLGHGRVIFGLDNDAEFADATTLARAVEALDSEPALAAIGCRILLYARATDDLSSWGYPGRLLPYAGESFDAVTFVGAGHAIRRAAWDGYDDALFFCWEELDFCLRAIERGWRIRYRGDIAVRHKVCAEHRFTWSGTRGVPFRAQPALHRAQVARRMARPAAPRRLLSAQRCAQRPVAADPGRRARSDPYVIRHAGMPALGSGTSLYPRERHGAPRQLEDAGSASVQCRAASRSCRSIGTICGLSIR